MKQCPRLLVLVALALTLLLSGAPRVALAAFGYSEPDCQTECSGSGATRKCPPNCEHGACAKVWAAPVAPPVAFIGQSTLAASVVHLSPAIPNTAPLLNGVFHPPRD